MIFGAGDIAGRGTISLDALNGKSGFLIEGAGSSVTSGATPTVMAMASFSLAIRTARAKSGRHRLLSRNYTRNAYCGYGVADG